MGNPESVNHGGSAPDGGPSMLKFTGIYAFCAFFYCIIMEDVPLWIPILYGVAFACWAAYRGAILFWRVTRGRYMLRFTVLYGLLLALVFFVVGPFASRNETLPVIAAALSLFYAAVLFLWLVVKGIGMLARRAVGRRAAQELAERQHQTRQFAADRRRREDARAACELLYQLHAHALGTRFPKESFDDYLRRYLSDGHAAEDVERRAAQLQDIIHRHVEGADAPPKHLSIEALNAWYQKTKETIERQSVEKKFRDVQTASLNQRYMQLMQELMEEMKP